MTYYVNPMRWFFYFLWSWCLKIVTVGYVENNIISYIQMTGNLIINITMKDIQVNLWLKIMDYFEQQLCKFSYDYLMKIRFRILGFTLHVLQWKIRISQKLCNLECVSLFYRNVFHSKHVLQFLDLKRIQLLSKIISYTDKY